MRVKISADSTCDLSKEYTEKYGIYIVPMCLIKDDKKYFDGQDISNEDIFKYFEENNKLCTTVALNPLQYLDHFKCAREDCDYLIHIDIGSNFSSCHNNAKRAAEEIDNVMVLDSHNLSTGFGMIVLEAAIMAQNGATPEEIKNEVSSLSRRVEASFVIDKLTYLRKGGRCSAIASFGSNLMNIKPCLGIEGGIMKVCKKYRGSFENIILKYVEDRLSGRDDIDYSRVFVTHPACPQHIVDSVIEKVKELADFKEIKVLQAGCSVSIHCGPLTLGIVFNRK